MTSFCIPTRQSLQAPIVQPPRQSTGVSPEKPIRLRNALKQLVEGVPTLHRSGQLHRDIGENSLPVASRAT
jgi:hypothetical protein